MYYNNNNNIFAQKKTSLKRIIYMFTIFASSKYTKYSCNAQCNFFFINMHYATKGFSCYKLHIFKNFEKQTGAVAYNINL